MSRVPPGGHSTLSFGYDAPAPATRSEQRTNPLLGGGADGERQPVRKPSYGASLRSNVPLGTASGEMEAMAAPVMRRSHSAKPTKSRVFGDDYDAAPAQPQSVAAPAPNRTQSSAIPVESEVKPFTPGKRILKTAANAQQESSLTSDEKFVPGLRQSNNGNRNQSSVDLALEGPSKSVGSRLPSGRHLKSVVAANQMQSTFKFGDDSPRAPDFSPKKFNRTGVKMLNPEVTGVARKKSLAEFTGFEAVGAGGKNAAAERVDPASVETVAGASTGKHRVY
ncbi:hypothetical protein BJ741DRAFT_7375 [Chytriomyces cf. hyalinus JEL632]|nr:hypothetical protein BJ741DRAFT_7375 [Chytriomyces cf. hyalinus JEL632]